MSNMSRVLAVTVALAVVPGQAGAAEPLGALSEPVASPKAAKLRTIMTLAESPEAGAARFKRPVACADEEPPRGIGMMITGGALAVPATAFMVYMGFLVRGLSTFCIDNCDENAEESGGVGLFVFGGVLFFTGVGLLAIGGYRFSEWRRWRARQQVLAPSVGRTAFGTWTPGLMLRF